MSMMMCV